MTKEELIAAAESIGMRFPGASIPPATEDQKAAERYRWLIDNSFDKGITQFHVWKHSWEPHSKTGEQIEWSQRISGPPLDAAIDDLLKGE